jgi:hypothetical protein
VSAIIGDADKKMKTRTLESVSKAADLYRQALLSKPDDSELQLKTADAINAIMRIRTNANTILIDGSLDTPENKAFWAKHGEEVCSVEVDPGMKISCPNIVLMAGLCPSQRSV